MHHDRSLPLANLCSPLFLFFSPLCSGGGGVQRNWCTDASDFVRGREGCNYYWRQLSENDVYMSDGKVSRNPFFPHLPLSITESHVFHVNCKTCLDRVWFILGWEMTNGRKWRKKRFEERFLWYTRTLIFAAIDLIGTRDWIETSSMI